jgi:hypothetical protein
MYVYILSNIINLLSSYSTFWKLSITIMKQKKRKKKKNNKQVR